MCVMGELLGVTRHLLVSPESYLCSRRAAVLNGNTIRVITMHIGVIQQTHV